MCPKNLTLSRALSYYSNDIGTVVTVMILEEALKLNQPIELSLRLTYKWLP